MGRKTYEQVLTFGAWPYEDKSVIVLSRNNIRFPENVSGTVSLSAESLEQLCGRLSYEGAKRLFIDGGITIQRFLDQGLINDVKITLIPVVLGSGKSLFGDSGHDIPPKHIAAKTYDLGFVQLTYEVAD